MVRPMDMEPSPNQTEKFTPDNGKMTNLMAKQNNCNQTEELLKVTSKIQKNMVSVYSNGLIIQYTKECG